MSMRWLPVAIATTLLGAAGCALLPPPSPADTRAQSLPNLQVPAAWNTQGIATADAPEGWVDEFDDPQLKALVREALAYNIDLKTAAARVELAGAQARLAGSTL